MSFKYRILLKGFSRGVSASRMTSYTNPGRNPLGMGPPSANPRWNSSHRLVGYARSGSTLSAATVERLLVSISFCVRFWNFVCNSDQNFHSFPPRKRRNFEILNFVHIVLLEKETPLSGFAFWFLISIWSPNPTRFPNQSRRLPFAPVFDSW